MLDKNAEICYNGKVTECKFRLSAKSKSPQCGKHIKEADSMVKKANIYVKMADAYVKKLETISIEQLVMTVRWYDENFYSSDRGECIAKLASYHKELSRTSSELVVVVKLFRKLSA